MPVAITVNAYDAVAGADAAVIATAWPEFALLDLTNVAELMDGELLIDARNVIDAADAGDAGLRVVTPGRLLPAQSRATVSALPAMVGVIDSRS